MKLLYTFLVFIFLLTTVQAQEVIVTLSGDTSTEGFHIKNNSDFTLFRVGANGNVGIGTNASGVKLLVTGDVKANRFLDFNNPSWFIDPASAISGVFSGKIGIGMTSPSNILTIKENSSTDPIADAWTEYSSKRWKENIKPLEGALNKVRQLQGVSFDWKADSKHDIGLIAEQVGEVIPEVVAYEENGKDARSVNYARLVSVIIEAIKEQQKQIEALERRISSLTLKEIDRTSYGYTKTNINK